MISCQDADILAAALSVGSVDARDQAAVERHLGACAECRRVAGNYLAVAHLMTLALVPLQPSPDLRGRLMRAVYAEASQADKAADKAVASQQTARWPRLWAGMPAARGFTALGAAAVAALIAVSSWTLFSGQGSRPAAVTVAMLGTASAPLAHGQLVYVPGGTQAVLTVAGLPAPATVAAGGGVYEVWLLRPTGSAVAAAYLSREPDGTWSTILHSALTGYSKVTATVEPLGGSRTPSRARVFQATLNNS